MQQDRTDVEDADYDSSGGARWYFSVYRGADDGWYWEPRTPTAAEISDVRVVQGISWEPTTVPSSEWPDGKELGPYRRRSEVITALEQWFERRQGPEGNGLA